MWMLITDGEGVLVARDKARLLVRIQFASLLECMHRVKVKLESCRNVTGVKRINTETEQHEEKICLLTR